MDGAYQALIDSDRVGPNTREALNERVMINFAGRPHLLNEDAFATLDAVTRRLIPQSRDVDFVDIAGGIDRALRNGTGDGWRYADLPTDRDAFELGLHAIEAMARRRHGIAFVTIGPLAQDEILRDMAAGGIDQAEINIKRWFEDLLAAAAELYVSHPATLAQIGFSGIAFRPRWTAVGLGTTRPWEPSPR